MTKPLEWALGQESSTQGHIYSLTVLNPTHSNIKMRGRTLVWSRLVAVPKNDAITVILRRIYIKK